MRVADIMSTYVKVIDSSTSIYQASRAMREHNIGSLPVVHANKLVGIITDRDISCFAIALGYDPATTPVHKIMTHKVITCHEEDDISIAALLMKQQHIRRIVVLDQNDKLAGILSIDNLAHNSHELAGEVLEAAEAIH